MGFKKIFATKLTEVNSSDIEGVGTIREENGNIYKYVKITLPSGTLPANSIVVWKNINEVEAGANTDAPRMAGFLQADVSAGTKYGWILVSGFSTFIPKSGYNPTNGDLIVPSSGSDGKVQKRDTANPESKFLVVIDATNRKALVDLM